jgi:RNA polymerase sigma factor (sigma-70 family)
MSGGGVGPDEPGTTDPEVSSGRGNGAGASGVHVPVNESAITAPRRVQSAQWRAPTRTPGSAVDGRADGVADALDPPTTEILTFDHFYAEHHTEVARALALTLGDGELGREAADEAMVRAYERWNVVRTYDSPAGWTYRVGLNWARSVLRRHRRRERLPLFEEGSTTMPELGEPAVLRALAALNDDQRAVVVCRFLLDWSVEETATALGVRPGTVQSRLHRAVHQLQARLSHLR